MEYRKDIYEASDQTIKSNQIDIDLFKDFIEMKIIYILMGMLLWIFSIILNSSDSIAGRPWIVNSLRWEAIPNTWNWNRFLMWIRCRFTMYWNAGRDIKPAPTLCPKEQVKSIFESIDRDSCLDVRDYAVYALMYKLGLRVGEVHKLNLENIDFNEKKITVLGKGNKRRSLHLDHEMTAILTQWIAVRKQFLNYDISNALFISKKGNRLAIRTIEDNFKKIIEKLNINVPFNVTCHTLRHSFASHLNDEDVDILVIQDLLGHATPRTTADYYIHPSEKKVREALEKLPGVIYMNKLVQSGFLKFQSHYCKREWKVTACDL